MSGIDNIFNNAASKAAQSKLAKDFNVIIAGIRNLELTNGDAYIKEITVEYVARKKALLDASIDLDADVTFAPKTRKKRTPKEESISNLSGTLLPIPEEKTLTAKEKAAAAKAAAASKKPVDDLN